MINKDTVCDACSLGMSAIKKWEHDMLDKHGWYVHYVNDSMYPYCTNIHTHGIQDHFDHPDLQVCLPLDSGVVQSILHLLVSKIKEGESFEPHQILLGILDGDYPITFVQRIEDGRSILRIIFPDVSGCLDRAYMDDSYRDQYAVHGVSDDSPEDHIKIKGC